MWYAVAVVAYALLSWFVYTLLPAKESVGIKLFYGMTGGFVALVFLANAVLVVSR